MDDLNYFDGVDLTIREGTPDISDYRVQLFFDYWCSIRKEGEIPYKKDLDPMAIVQCLPHVWVYRYLDDQKSFICDLAGEDINQTWNKNLRGKMLEEIFNAYDSKMLKLRWLYSFNNHALLYGRFHENGGKKTFERIALPLKDNDGLVKFIFGISIYAYEALLYSDETPEFKKNDVSFYGISSL